MKKGEELIQKGKIEFSKGNLANAAKCFKEATITYPNAQTHYLLAKSLWMQNKHSEAKRSLSEAYQCLSNNSNYHDRRDILELMASFEKQSGNPERAKEFLKLAKEECAGKLTEEEEWIIKREMDDIDSITEDCKAHDKYPLQSEKKEDKKIDIDSYYVKGISCHRKGECKDAIESLKTYLTYISEVDVSKAFECALQIGQCYIEEGLFIEAVSQFEEALSDAMQICSPEDQERIKLWVEYSKARLEVLCHS